jgi:hypothetical protein
MTKIFHVRVCTSIVIVDSAPNDRGQTSFGALIFAMISLAISENKYEPVATEEVADLRSARSCERRVGSPAVPARKRSRLVARRQGAVSERPD